MSVCVHAWVGMYTCLCVCRYMYVAYTCTPESNLNCHFFSDSVTLFCETGSRIKTGSSVVRLGWLGSQPQGISLSLSVRAGIRIALHTWLVAWVLEIKLRTSCLPG